MRYRYVLDTVYFQNAFVRIGMKPQLESMNKEHISVGKCTKEPAFRSCNCVTGQMRPSVCDPPPCEYVLGFRIIHCTFDTNHRKFCCTGSEEFAEHLVFN